MVCLSERPSAPGSERHDVSIFIRDSGDVSHSRMAASQVSRPITALRSDQVIIFLFPSEEMLSKNALHQQSYRSSRSFIERRIGIE